MSLLPGATNYSPTEAYFLFANISTAKFQNIVANSVTAPVGNFENLSTVSTALINAPEGFISTAYCKSINLDDNILTTDTGGGGELLLNGIPIATAQNLSTIGDWALFEAVSTINMGGFDIQNLNRLRASNIYTNNLVASNFVTENYVSTNNLSVQTILASTINCINGNFNFLSTNKLGAVSISTNNLYTSNAYGNSAYFNSISTGSINISTISVPLLSTPVILTSTIVANSISTNTLLTNSINGLTSFDVSKWANYAAVSTINMNGKNIVTNADLTIAAPLGSITGSGAGLILESAATNIIADRGAAVGLNTNLNITAQNGYRGIINIEAAQGFAGLNGILNLKASGGTVGGIGQGGLINMTAITPVGVSNLTSAIRQSAGSVESYAGITTPITSVFGYNFIAGNLGVEICAGLPPSIPNVPGTVYLYGTTGVTFGAPAYITNIYPYWNGIGAGNDLSIQGRVIGIQQVHVKLSNVSYAYFDGDAQISGVSTLYTQYESCSSLTVSTINGSVPLTNYISTFGSLSTQSLLVSSINGAKPITQYISSFPLLFTSTLNTDLINSKSTLQITSKDDMLLVSQSGQEVFLASQYQFPGGPIQANTINCSSLNQSTNQIYQHNIRQPFIQYGTFGATGNTGNSTITLSVPYTNSSFTSIASMNDTVPAQMSCFNTSPSTIRIYWANAGGGAQQICWTTMGNIN